ncbi:MAG: ketopantoate reductase family protein [Bacillota bacterium]
MRAAIVGAGVIGSVMAAYLGRAGHHVDLLARGQRLTDLRQHGVVVRNGITGQRVAAEVAVVEQLAHDQAYEVAIAAVKHQDIDGLIPLFQDLPHIPTIVLMANGLTGQREFAQQVGAERVILGFPGFGGGRTEKEIIFTTAPTLIQTTTFGELEPSQITPRVNQMAQTLTNAGLHAVAEKNMLAWQRTHVAWVSPFANAIHVAGDSHVRLAARLDLIRLMLHAVRESLAAMERLGTPITPAKISLLRISPIELSARIAALAIPTKLIELIATLHCKSAPEEMRTLSEALITFTAGSGMDAPHLRELHQLAWEM